MSANKNQFEGYAWAKNSLQDASKKARLLNVLAHLSVTDDEIEKEVLEDYIYYELHIAYGLEVLTMKLNLKVDNIEVVEKLPDDLLKHIIAEKYRRYFNEQAG